MDDAGSISAEEGAELLARLGYALVGAGYSGGLTPAQWAALRYLIRANRFSRTVSAFADFHATTRGTASQTMQRLVDTGLVRKDRSPIDGRSFALELTEEGRATLKVDPLNDVVDAVAGLSSSARARLVGTLKELVDRVAQARGDRSFGTCPACLHFDCGPDCPGDGEELWCRLFDQPLRGDEIDELCANCQPVG